MARGKYGKPITLNGETKHATEWCKQYGIDYASFNSRLRRGWSVYDALTKPIEKNKITFKYRGRIMTPSQASKLPVCSVTPNIITQRIFKLHWTPEDAVEKPYKFKKGEFDYPIPKNGRPERCVGDCLKCILPHYCGI